MAFVYYNPNPQGLHVGDCVIRAISKATDSSWEQTYMNIMIYGFMMSDMPSANRVWREYLRSKGFKKYIKYKGYRFLLMPLFVSSMWCNGSTRLLGSWGAVQVGHIRFVNKHEN